MFLGVSSCSEYNTDYVFAPDSPDLKEVAKLLSELPIGVEQMMEVHDAVSSSSENGYDEEYTLEDVFNSPGAGVGDNGTKAGGKSYQTPLRDLIKDHLGAREGTKSGFGDVDSYIEKLCSSGYQIYWPYSEDWDGETSPLITFDPGYGASSNYAYEFGIRDGRIVAVDSVYVDENVALSRPVWVVNHNNDSAFTPVDFYSGGKGTLSGNSAGTRGPVSGRAGVVTKGMRRKLILKDFTMLRNYDSWFAGASEFMVKCGSVNGFEASSEEDLSLYRPNVTDFMIVVRRRDLGKKIPFDAIIVDDLPTQVEKLAFLINEDDGGTTTSWKCSAVVKYNSRSYGFECEIPYKDKDDIVWRGQLSTSYFLEEDTVSGRFGDVMLTFSVE